MKDRVTIKPLEYIGRGEYKLKATNGETFVCDMGVGCLVKPPDCPDTEPEWNEKHLTHEEFMSGEWEIHFMENRDFSVGITDATERYDSASLKARSGLENIELAIKTATAEELLQNEAVKGLVEALRFYANMNHIDDLQDTFERDVDPSEPGWGCDDNDKFNLEDGLRAREALKKFEVKK